MFAVIYRIIVGLFPAGAGVILREELKWKRN